jgi:hypothetical protein
VELHRDLCVYIIFPKGKQFPTVNSFHQGKIPEGIGIIALSLDLLNPGMVQKLDFYG